MKRLFFVFSGLVFFMISIVSCDKVDFPYENVKKITIDTTLFPGNWNDYETNYYPTFSENTNTKTNVLIEDYTGHLCSQCPPAADAAHAIHQLYPNRVFVASIHIDPGSMLSYQEAFPSLTKFYTDFTNPDGIEYGKEFETGYNFIGNPSGTINRKTVNGKMFDVYGTWQSRTEDILNANELKMNLQSEFNYFQQTNGGFLHVEIEKETTDPINTNIVVYVIQDSVVDWQKMTDNTNNPNYIHRDIHRGSIDNHPWGMEVFDETAKKGDKIVFDYSYQIPAEYSAANLHFLIYVYNVETHEILQVIRQDIN